jgi:hypothetical protein
MSAAKWFQLRDRIDALLHEVLDPVVPNADTPPQAYTNAVRTAAERLLSEFEISENRIADGSERLRLQMTHGPILDQTLFARGPQFPETSRARGAVSRRIFDTPMETTIIPIVVGWAHRTDVAEDLLSMASNLTVAVRIVGVLKADDGLPGSLAAARITFDLTRGASVTRHEITVSGSDAIAAIEAWHLR